jgi:uncharacterized membrane protein
VVAWEGETAHRHAAENRALDAEIADQRIERKLETRGQWFAFLLATIFFGGSMFLIERGYGEVGIATIVAEIAGLAAVFIFGRKAGPDKPPSATDKEQDKEIDS